MKRDVSIELLRLVLMFLICMIHAVGYVPARWNHWLANVCFVGVLGFVLISGYFGIRFTWTKVFRLEGVGLGCATTVVALSALFDPENRAMGQALGEIVRLWKGYWFIHAYVVMMALAPLVETLFRRGEIAAEARSILRTALPFVLMVYGWSFLMLVPGVQRFVPRTPGLEPFSGLTLFAVYLTGRLYREFNLDSLLKARWVVPVMLFSAVGAACVIPPTNGWGGVFARYNSPCLLFFALGFFWCFRKAMGRLDLNWLGRPLSRLGSSVFSIYLIHCNDYGYRVFDLGETWLRGHGAGSAVVFLCLAGGAFAAGILLDLPRRMVAKALLMLRVGE